LHPQYSRIEIHTKRTPNRNSPLLEEHPDWDIWAASVVGYDAHGNAKAIKKTEHNPLMLKEGAFASLDRQLKEHLRQVNKRARLESAKYQWQVYSAGVEQ
jgi:hypothetical protein